jgi:hypothetical protein
LGLGADGVNLQRGPSACWRRVASRVGVLPFPRRRHLLFTHDHHAAHQARFLPDQITNGKIVLACLAAEGGELVLSAFVFFYTVVVFCVGVNIERQRQRFLEPV